MKPFNIEAAQRGDTLITRSGEPARFIAYVPDEGRPGWQVLALISDRVLPFFTDGNYYACGVEDSNDLFMETKKKTLWVNLYPDTFKPRECLHSGFIYETEMLADANADSARIGNKAWPLEIEK